MLYASLARLEQKLKKVTLKNFEKNLTAVRAAAFEVEFLGKFYRKVHPKDRAAYKQLIHQSKQLEDRLGQVGETLELIQFIKVRPIRLPNGDSALQVLTLKANEQLKETFSWMQEEGWLSPHPIKNLMGLLETLHWLDSEEALLDYAQDHICKSLLQLQEDIDEGVYDPGKNGYHFKQVETRVHKLRRDIRKQAQYMSYTEGLFSLVDSKHLPSRARDKKCLKHYSSLLKSNYASDAFSELPASRVQRPLKVPKSLFFALNRYIYEFGQAKDWVFHLAGLKELGIKGKIDLDQLDIRLLNGQLVPTPFNQLVTDNLSEIRSFRLFSALHDSIEKSR